MGNHYNPSSEISRRLKRAMISNKAVLDGESIRNPIEINVIDITGLGVIMRLEEVTEFHVFTSPQYPEQDTVKKIKKIRNLINHITIEVFEQLRAGTFSHDDFPNCR